MDYLIIFVIIFTIFIYYNPPTPPIIESYSTQPKYPTEQEELAYAILEFFKSRTTTFTLYSKILYEYKNTFTNLGTLNTYKELKDLSNKQRLTIQQIFTRMY